MHAAGEVCTVASKVAPFLPRSTAKKSQPTRVRLQRQIPHGGKQKVLVSLERCSQYIHAELVAKRQKHRATFSGPMYDCHAHGHGGTSSRSRSASSHACSSSLWRAVFRPRDKTEGAESEFRGRICHAHLRGRRRTAILHFVHFLEGNHKNRDLFQFLVLRRVQVGFVKTQVIGISYPASCSPAKHT